MPPSQASSWTRASGNQFPTSAAELSRTHSLSEDNRRKKGAYSVPPVHQEETKSLENNFAIATDASIPTSIHVPPALAEEARTSLPIYPESRRQSSACRGATAQSLRRSGGRKTLTHKGLFRSVKIFSIIALLLVVVRQALRIYSVCLTSEETPKGLTDGRNARRAAGPARRLAGIGDPNGNTKQEACMREATEGFGQGNEEAVQRSRGTVTRPAPAGEGESGAHHPERAEEQQPHSQTKSPAATPQEEQEGGQLPTDSGALVAEQQEQERGEGRQQGAKVSGSHPAATSPLSVRESSAAADLISWLSQEGRTVPSSKSPLTPSQVVSNLFPSPKGDKPRSGVLRFLRGRRTPAGAGNTGASQLQRAEEQQSHQQTKSPAATPQEEKEGGQLPTDSGAVVAKQQQQERGEGRQQGAKVSWSHPAATSPLSVRESSAAAGLTSRLSLQQSSPPVTPSQAESNPFPPQAESTAGLRLRGSERVAFHQQGKGAHLQRPSSREQLVEQMLQEGISLGDVSLVGTAHSGGEATSTAKRPSAGSRPQGLSAPTWRTPTASLQDLSVAAPRRTQPNPFAAVRERFSRKKRSPTPAASHTSPSFGGESPLQRVSQSMGSLGTHEEDTAAYLVPAVSALPRQRSGVQWKSAKDLTASIPTTPVHERLPRTTTRRWEGRRSSVGSRSPQPRHGRQRLAPFDSLSRASTLADIPDSSQET